MFYFFGLRTEKLHNPPKRQSRISFDSFSFSSYIIYRISCIFREILQLFKVVKENTLQTFSWCTISFKIVFFLIKTPWLSGSVKGKGKWQVFFFFNETGVSLSGSLPSVVVQIECRLASCSLFVDFAAHKFTHTRAFLHMLIGWKILSVLLNIRVFDLASFKVDEGTNRAHNAKPR